MSERLPVPRRSTLQRLTYPLLQDEWTEEKWAGRQVSLSVYTTGVDLTARDFAAYLRLMDSAYGRTWPEGFLSYSHRPDSQLQISSVRDDSWVLEVLKELNTPENLWGIVLAYLVLRTGPKLIVGEAARNWGEAVKSWGEALQVWGDLFERRWGEPRRDPPARLVRAQRRRLRQIIKSDPKFSELDSDDIDRLAEAVEHVLVYERDNLKAASRFAASAVIAVELEKEDETPSSSS